MAEVWRAGSDRPARLAGEPTASFEDARCRTQEQRKRWRQDE
jgi:hypothetical protein